MNCRLYLVPAPLGDNPPQEVIPPYVYTVISHVRNFAVEDIRSARRYLSKIGFKGMIDSLSFYEVNEHSAQEDIEGVFKVFAESGEDMAVISEAGLPAVADPGAALVALAQKAGMEVVPLSGPSSLMMALMASGMNGQCFAFAGYVPVRGEERRKRLKELEARSRKYSETEIMIETPYRSDSLFQDILAVCGPSTRLCVAADITLPGQYIRTRTVAEWKKTGLTISRRPAVFLILA
ncbi:MAG TPA: SAM-dependent methyltransferase [Candidatus Coprenecus stercoravium]|uniref:SAM-dependent methyltransferase n=1 Tax=Candidatus Coprenecus stercoravium TaxID=2840735 RepID=A0A9D2GQR3_9BACT|nr:SAM-dependent methyltransferase [Candidatus Coprenecus stercoravium]